MSLPKTPKLLQRMQAVHRLTLPWDEKAVLVWLAFYAGESWPKCWPTRKTLAHDVGCHPRQVTRATAKLAERGLIALETRKDQSNVYTLKLPLDCESIPMDCESSTWGTVSPPEPRRVERRIERGGLDEDDPLDFPVDL